MQVTALTTIFGDYGLKHRGDVFTLPDTAMDAKSKYLSLFSRGLVDIYRPDRIRDRTRYVVYAKPPEPAPAPAATPAARKKRAGSK